MAHLRFTPRAMRFTLNYEVQLAATINQTLPKQLMIKDQAQQVLRST